MRTARDFEVLASEADGMLSRAEGYATAGAEVLAADIVVPDYTPARAVGTVDVTAATAITQGQKVKIVSGAVNTEYTAAANATVADLITFFEGVRAGLVALVGGKLRVSAKGYDSVAITGTASAALFGTGLNAVVTKLDTYRPVRTSDALDPAAIADASIAPAQAFDGGFIRIFQIATIKDAVVRWPESADADADSAAKAALIGVFANRHIITR